MTWDSKESELRCRLFARVGANFIHYKQLTEWLEVYQYILPDARKFHQCSPRITSPSHAYHVWKFIDLMPTALTEHEQELVWQLINESKTSVIPLS